MDAEKIDSGNPRGDRQPPRYRGRELLRVKAYHNAAKILAGLDDLETIIAEGRLREIKGIGDTLAVKIAEYVETGRIAFHEELKSRIPVSLVELLQVPNLGPEKIKMLYDELGITSLGELEYACRENRLSTSSASARERRRRS